jgi:hypothetical protein
MLTNLALTFLLKDNPTIRTDFGDISVTLMSCFGAAGLIYAWLNADEQ